MWKINKKINKEKYTIFAGLIVGLIGSCFNGQSNIFLVNLNTVFITAVLILTLIIFNIFRSKVYKEKKENVMDRIKNKKYINVGNFNFEKKINDRIKPFNFDYLELICLFLLNVSLSTIITMILKLFIGLNFLIVNIISLGLLYCLVRFLTVSLKEEMSEDWFKWLKTDYLSYLSYKLREIYREKKENIYYAKVESMLEKLFKEVSYKKYSKIKSESEELIEIYIILYLMSENTDLKTNKNTEEKIKKFQEYIEKIITEFKLKEKKIKQKKEATQNLQLEEFLNNTEKRGINYE